MRRVLSWIATFAIALVAVVALIMFFNSRDKSGLDQPADAAGPGSPYRGAPALSPALRRAVGLGNVVVLYRAQRPPAGLRRLVPPGGAALAQAGQYVFVKRDPALRYQLSAVAATKYQNANTPQELQSFVDYWLGGRG